VTAPLAHLAESGATIEVKVRPGARRNAVTADDDGVKVEVTAAPEDGKANKAVQKLLAKALGVAPSRLTLVRGATARIKQFRLDA